MKTNISSGLEISPASLIQLARLILDMFRYLSRDVGKRFTEGITLGQLVFLKKIDAGCNKVCDLSEKLRITPAAASKTVDCMVEADLISRFRSEDDKRVSILRLTGRGKEALHKNILILKEIMDESFGVLSQEEIDELIRIFTKVISQYD